MDHLITFEEVERPPRNKKKLGDDMPWDAALEAALFNTLDSQKAIRVSLVMFHSSPAKGRLWKKGYAVRHRVQGNHVAAWVEKVTQPTQEDLEFNGELPF